jgi:hypothetical protein
MNFRYVKILVLICIVLFPVVPLPGGSANSAVIEGGRDYYLGPEGAIDDDLYIAGGNIEVMGAVLGDLTAAGGNLYAKGKISQDVQLAGGHLRIEGQIGDDLRAAGGMLYVNGIVNGDAFLAGGHVTVGPEAVLKRGVWIAGNEVRILGSMDGEVRIAANTVTVNGIISNKLYIHANQVIIGEKAAITGPVYYSAPQEATIDPGARVEEGLQFQKTEAAPVTPAAFFTFIWFIKAVVIAAAAVLFFLVFRKWTANFALKVSSDFAQDLLRGLVLLFIVPIFSILALMTVILAVPGIAAMLVYALFTIVAFVFGGIVLGSLAAKHAFRRPDYEVNWKTVVLGVVALQFIGLIPVLGWLTSIVFFLAAFGGLFHLLYKNAWQTRHERTGRV